MMETLSHNKLTRVIIVGRANVGKSSLFNRLTSTKRAIVSALPGTTRNALSSIVEWRGICFLLLDSGGLLGKPEDSIEKAIDLETNRELGTADLVLLVVDSKDGILAPDRTWAKRLYNIGKPVLLVSNKADSAKLRAEAKVFTNLGLGEAVPVSASNGSGAGDLLDKIVECLGCTETQKWMEQKGSLEVAIVGRPNVGKTSLMNMLAKTDVGIVSEIPHTTRDIQEYEIEFPESGPVTLIDTAGMRKKIPRFKSMGFGKRALLGAIEIESVRRSKEALEQAPLILLVLDVCEPAAYQDRTIARLTAESNRGVIIILNKIDQLKNNSKKKIEKMKKWIKNFFPHLDYAPIIAVSCRTGFGIEKIPPMIASISENYNRKLDSELFENILEELMRRLDLPKDKPGRSAVNFLGLEQTGTAPPAFTLILARKTTPPKAAFGILEKILRERFDFTGTPIRIETRRVKNV